MQASNAVKKLIKAGFVVQQKGLFYKAMANRFVISFIEQESGITCINIRHESDKDDVQSDYSAGCFCDNLSQAIRLAH